MGINTYIYIEDENMEHEINVTVEYKYTPGIPASHWDPPEGPCVDIYAIKPEQLFVKPTPTDIYQNKKSIDIKDYINANWYMLTKSLEQECLNHEENQ